MARFLQTRFTCPEAILEAFFIIYSLPTVLGVPFWISEPTNPTYAVKGSQILLNWTFSYDSSNPSFRKWIEATEAGGQIGKRIMSKYETDAVRISRAEYQGRLEFVENGGFLLSNVSLNDEGYIRFSVDFDDGNNLESQVMLNVTIPPSVISALPNETIALEGRPFTSECIFESRPIPEIKWLINNGLLVNGSRFHIKSQIIGAHNNVTTVRSTLTIHNVTLNDDGRIMCTAGIPLGNLSSASRFIVHYAPKSVDLTVNRLNGIAVLGEKVQFTCNATSLPVSSYELRHNGILIMNSTKQTFEIANVSLANEGTYSCMAYNYIGSSVVMSRNLTIYVRPSIITPLSKTTIVIEDRAETFQCSFKAKPAPSVQWRKNGLPLVNGSNIQLLSVVTENPRNLSLVQSSLTIRSVTLNDTGNLACVAEHPFGNTSSSTYIVVHYAPKTPIFVLNKLDGIAVLGENVQFTCNATSLPVSSFELRHNGILIMNSTKQTFEIANVSLANEGTYSCMAYNYIGPSAVTSRNLTIYVPPILHSHSNDVTTVMINSSISLVCAFIGEPAPIITWYRIDGSIYTEVNSTSKTLVANESFSIIESVVSIRNVRRSDHGRYKCRAVNQVGASERNVTLNVTYTPLTNATFEKNYTLVEDVSNNATWKCSLESNPPGEIKWYLNGSAIPSSGFEIVEKILSNTSSGILLQSELTMIGISRKKAGLLMCNASNSIGYSTVTTIVIVHFPPTNLTVLSETYVRRNGSGRFQIECIFDANPGAQLTWKYNNNTRINNKYQNVTEVVLSSNAYNTRKKTVLRIDMVDEQLQGIYQCIATNQQGNATQKTKLIVQYAPIFLASLAPLLVKKDNESVILNCKVQSNPEARIEWYRNGVKMYNGSNIVIMNKIVSQNEYETVFESNLYIKALTKMDSANYTCKSENIIGLNQADGKLIIQYGPEITESFKSVENLTETTSPFTLSCKVEAFPKPIVQWYYNGQIALGNITEKVIEVEATRSVIQSTFTFSDGIARSDNGTYACNASNAIGSSMKSVTLNVWYVPDMLSHLNGTMNLLKLSNITFECKAQGYPVPEIKWYKDGKVLPNIPVRTTSLSTTKALVESSLILKTITKNDTAEYKCEVGNIAGKKEQTISLNVLFEPVLPVFPPNITANQSQRVELNCFSDANPPVTTYKWAKDGVLLAETSSIYVIPSAQEASSGVYTCGPIHSLGTPGNVTYNLYIQVPAHITKAIECTKSDTKLVCSCEAHGIPTPEVFWTKGNSLTVLETGNDFNLTVGRGKDGRYHCNAVNKLAKAVNTYNVFLYEKPVGEWSIWGACNISCGTGYQLRTRQCIFKPCPEHLFEFQACNGSCMTPPNITTSGNELTDTGNSSDEAWSVVLYVLIPVLAVMVIVLVVWLANVRGCRREEKEFIVPLNNSLSQPPSIRSMPTRRGIFLPDNNFGVLNSGYRPDGADVLPSLNGKNYDTVEVEMQFADDLAESKTEEAPKRGSRHEIFDDRELMENNTDADGEGRLSFYNSAYTHL